MMDENNRYDGALQADNAHASELEAPHNTFDNNLPPESAPTNEETLPKRNKYADKMNHKRSGLSKRVRIGVGITALVLLLVAGIVFVIITRGLGREHDVNATAVASYGMIETYIEGTGVTAARVREELGLDIQGTVTEVLVEVGDEVHAGDELLVIDPTDTRQELETVQDELTQAQSAVSTAQSELTQAQSVLNNAQGRLSRQNITAPFAGKVIPAEDGVTYRVGQQVGEGEVVGYMIDDSRMSLTLPFSAAYVNTVQTGQSATVSIPSAMSEVSGTVASVDRTLRVSEDGAQVFRVVISIDNASGMLTKGMTATAAISAGSAGTVYPADAGTLVYSREEAIAAPISGEITALNGMDYNSYRTGDTIMRLSSASAQDEVASAQAGVTAARNGVSAAQQEVADKRARVSELQRLINDSTIESPIDGVVVSMNAVENQAFSGTEPLVVVADLGNIIVNAEVMSTDVGAVEAGQYATMSMYTNDGSQLMLTGVVESVALEPTQDTNSMQGSMPTFNVVIAIDPIEGQSIYSGMMVEYQITTASSMNCLMVPSRAVVNTEDGTAVFARPLVNENGEEIPFSEILTVPEGTEGIPEGYYLVPVETGISDGTNTEIYWGIDEGTTVYLAGPQDIYADVYADAEITF